MTKTNTLAAKLNSIVFLLIFSLIIELKKLKRKKEDKLRN